MLQDSGGVPKTPGKLDFTRVFGTSEEASVFCRPLADGFKSTPPCFHSPTKASLYGAILFTLQETHWLPVSKSTLILIFTLFMATTKVGPRKRRERDPRVLWSPERASRLFSPLTGLVSPQAVMTARHSHGSPFSLVESWLCFLLFGSPVGGSEDDHHHHHAPAAAPASPLKSKEELSEGTRKRKVKKAE